MKRAMEALNTAQHKAAETLYKAASAGGAGEGAAEWRSLRFDQRRCVYRRIGRRYRC